MQFEMSGSSIILNNVTVSGEATAFDGNRSDEGSPWHVALNLDHGLVDWTRPLQINTDAVLANSRGEHGWI